MIGSSRKISLHTGVLALNLLLTTSLMAAFPTARSGDRLAFDAAIGRVVMFGGVASPDASAVRHELNDTWEWTGLRWVQIFPQNSPSPRFAPAMTYDSTRQQVLLFGGSDTANDPRDPTTFFNDTWAFRNENWIHIDTANAPSPRSLAAMVVNPANGNVLLYGGSDASTPAYDTWEFNGATWTQLISSGPKVTSPTMVYDAERQEILLMGFDPDAIATAMYRWTGSAWSKITPAHIPSCPLLSAMVYQTHSQRVLFVGGQCASGGVVSEVWEWDGTDWTKITVTGSAGSIDQFGLAYDELRQETLLFGGDAFGAVSATARYRDGTWKIFSDTSTPGPRSLPVFIYDPVRNVDWLFGGLNEAGDFFDLWSLSPDGVWQMITATDAPSDCAHPAGTFDTDRGKLVIVCESSDVFEWDGSVWKKTAATKDGPNSRRFSSFVYDPKLKKSVLFGGFNTNYSDETWTWDGAVWARVAKGKKAPINRGLHSMFYDTKSEKIMLFGGIGREAQTGTVTRFNDMWSFDGTSWTEVKPPAVPNPHYGSQVAYNPVSKTVLLFGGKNEEEQYVNDQWEWDGTTWKNTTQPGAPSPRMNGGFTYDSGVNAFRLFGGYAGLYFSELWRFDTSWKIEATPASRRRGARVGAGGVVVSAGGFALPE